VTRLTILDNGVRVVTTAMAGLETASVGLFARAGSRHESAELNGLAHLFEHMVFKGAGGRTAREISEAIEDVGGELNACTERDSTSFTAAVLGEHVPLAIDLIADMLRRPHFDAAELDREKHVVLQELAEVEDTPSDLIFDELWAAAFSDQPLGRSILGDEASIGRIQVDDLQRWSASRYGASDLILAAAGKVDHDELVRLAERQFGDVAEGRAAEDGARFAGGARTIGGRSDQAHLTLAFEGPPRLANEQLSARLFADVVGGGASSRLFQELREERGLAYSVSASLHSYSDTGLFSVHAATSRSESAAAGQLVQEVLAAAAADASQRELDRARMQARAALLMQLESPWGQMAYAARQLAVRGRVADPSEFVDRLAKVDLDQLRAAGARMLSGPSARATIGVPAARAA
jgi:predicted Zn-dependent peptidase